MRRRDLLLSLIFAATPAYAKGLGGGRRGGLPAAMRAFDFYSKFGVNGNLDSGGSVPVELTDMGYIGIKNIRSSIFGANAGDANSWASYIAGLTAAGVRQHIEIQCGGSVPFGLVSDWINALKTYIVTPYGANMVTGVCGPNETNLQFFGYNRPSSTVLNPFWHSSRVTLSAGDLTITHTGANLDGITPSLCYHSSGSYSFSVTFVNAVGTVGTGVGFMNAPISPDVYLGSDTTGVGVFSSDGMAYVNGSAVGSTGVTTWTSGTIIDVAVTITAGTSLTLWVRKRGGNWNNNPANSPGGSGGITITGLIAVSGYPNWTVAPAISLYPNGDIATADFTTDLGIVGFPPWGGMPSDTIYGVPAANAVQADLYAAIKADPALRDIPVDMWPVADVFNPAVLLQIGDMTAYCDRADLHDYYAADNVNQPTVVQGPLRDALQSYLTSVRQISNRHKFVTTETGWYTPTAVGYPGPGTNEYVQARLVLNDFFDHAMLPYCDQCYLFTLRWGTVDLTDPGYGVIHDDGTPKISGTALRNLMAIITDAGGTAATFSPGSFNYSLSGMPAAGNNFVIAKSTGAFDIILWNETQIWNNTTATQIPISSSSVTVTLPRSMTGNVYDPINSGTTPIASVSGNSVTVSLNDAPLIIEVI